MLLCDIGNSSYHFSNGTQEFKHSVKSFLPESITQQTFYISVNRTLKQKLHNLTNWIDLEDHIDRKNYYETMGIDRIVALETVENGVVIDAGSAITVDVVKKGVFEGGFIYPGVNAMAACYKNISPALDYSFNFELDLGKMPKNSTDAISYGYLKAFRDEIKSKNLPIIITGGDALEFKKLIPEATVDNKLLFKGMKKIIKKANLC